MTAPSLRLAALLSLLSFLLALAPPASLAQLQETKIVAPDGMDDDFFGEAVAIDGNRVVVGVRTADIGNFVNAGAAYAFERIDGQWQHVQKLTAPTVNERDFFGESVALEGDRLLIGAMGNDDKMQEGGAVYAFERIDGQWQLVQSIYPEDPQDFHGFGWEIALQRDRAFIGAPQDEDVQIQAGAVYLFERNALSGEWVQQQKLLPDNDGNASFFGTAMGLDGDYLLISSPTDHTAADLAGAAYVFAFNGIQWERAEKLLPPPVAPPDSLESDTFSREVALHGDWAMIGSSDDEQCINEPLFDPQFPNSCTSGAVFAYQRQANGDWELRQKIAPDELEQFDFFGFLSIAIEGNRAVVGARGDDDACPDPQPPNPLFCDPGAVYLLEWTGAAWQQIDKLTASDADSLDFLGGAFFGQGRSVGINGSHVIAGAPTVGVSDDISTKGKAYIFKIANQAPLAADDEATTDAGIPVSIDVLSNDSDPDYDALSVNVAADPANGSATVNADQTITYTPAAGFSGTDSFTYALDDGDGGTDEAAVTITVIGVNAAPVVVQGIDNVMLTLGGDAFTTDLSTVFSDPDGDPLAFSASSSDAAFATATVASSTLTVEAVALGSATITAFADDGNGGTASTSFAVSIPTGVAVDPAAHDLPTTVALFPNYPNPFNPSTEIAFALPETAHVYLAVFDVLGRPVAILVDRPMPAGRHTAVFEAGELPSGLYIYRLQTGQEIRARTMLLLK